MAENYGKKFSYFPKLWSESVISLGKPAHNYPQYRQTLTKRLLRLQMFKCMTEAFFAVIGTYSQIDGLYAKFSLWASKPTNVWQYFIIWLCIGLFFLLVFIIRPLVRVLFNCMKCVHSKCVIERWERSNMDSPCASVCIYNLHIWCVISLN